MRKQKFKAWDKKYNQWIKITPMTAEAIYCEFTISGKSSPNQRILDGKTGKNIFVTLDGLIVSVCPEGRLKISVRDESSRYILVQHIGLKDEDDKEVYDGDIVHVFVTPSPFLIKMVEWVDGGVDYCINPGFVLTSGDGGDAGFMPFNLYRIKIIGNRYENPELIIKIKEMKKKGEFASYMSE